MQASLETQQHNQSNISSPLKLNNEVKEIYLYIYVYVQMDDTNRLINGVHKCCVHWIKHFILFWGSSKSVCLISNYV